MRLDRNGVDLDHDPDDDEYWKAAIAKSFAKARETLGDDTAVRILNEAALLVTGKDGAK